MYPKEQTEKLLYSSEKMMSNKKHSNLQYQEMKILNFLLFLSYVYFQVKKSPWKQPVKQRCCFYPFKIVAQPEALTRIETTSWKFCELVILTKQLIP